MSENSSSSSPRTERRWTPDVLTSDTDHTFLRSLSDFIAHEKRYLQCPDTGPDEVRYMIYRSAFNKVITRSTAYKRLLLTIKAEYDETIQDVKRRQEEARSRQPTSLATCRTRAARLRDRISGLHGETAEHEEQIQRRRSLRQQSTWIPGLSVAESEDAEALDRHLQLLRAQRDALLDTRRRRVPAELGAETRRQQLSGDVGRLKALYQRLRLVGDCLSSWEEQGQRVPLEELLGSTLQNIRAANDDSDAAVFEEPSGGDESGFLTDHLHRFTELFASARFEDAAFLAARSPGGVLRSLDTLEMFRGATAPPGSAPPLLCFCQALLMTAAVGKELPAPLSAELVRGVLQYDASELVAHAVTHSKLTLSEDVGDILTEHAHNNPAVCASFLALATSAYEACGSKRKMALSMCRRGLIHSAAELLTHGFTADDRLWILRRSRSPALLRLVTRPEQGRAATCSAGALCCSLLCDARQQEVALQLLDSFVREEVLEEVILKDCTASVDVWTHVSSLCSGLNRSDLSRGILSVLLQQSGTRALSPDLEGARLMEHVFL